MRKKSPMGVLARGLTQNAEMTTSRRNKQLIHLQGNLLGVISAIVLLTLVLVAVAAPLVAPYDPYVMTPTRSFEAPSAAHLFGTDEFGRDILSRVIFATRISVGTAVVVVVFASAVGVPMGLVAGYFGGTADTIIMRLIDTILAFPAILLAMGLIAVMGQSAINGMIAVIIVSIPAFARLVRASTLQQKELEYVEASRIVGSRDFRIMLRTILPNCLPPLLVQVAINATWAVLLEAGLSFLGLGVKPPTPSWGQMLNVSRNYLYRSPWYGLFPGVFLTVLVLSLNTLADTLQKILSRGRIQ
jgi:peptide/nickel transport system permease protein